MGKLDGKIAVITGGNSGIGLATAKRFVAEGAFVFVTGRRKDELDHAVADLGRSAVGVQGDVSRIDDLERLFARVRETKGGLDIVFANAGIGVAEPLAAITEASFDRQIAINVKGVLFTVQKALPLLRDGASIIVNSSIAGSIGGTNVSVYNATKAALRSFARTWTSELAGRGVRVNVISPGYIDTPGARGLTNADAAGGMDAQFRDRIPLGRVGRPDEIASAVTFLASDDSSYVAGSELFVDGGAAQV